MNSAAHPSHHLGGLLWTLVRTDFKVRYHGTVGGFVWALLKPLAIFAVLASVFSYIFPSASYGLNLLLGLVLWEFFAEGTKTGLMALHARSFLIAKTQLPRWLLVVSSLSNAAITLVVMCLAFVGLLVVTGRSPSLWGVGLFLLYVSAMGCVVVGFALASSVLFLRYRDLNQVWEVILQAGFFVAPIIYPLGILPERLHRWVYLWPPTSMIEFSRQVLLEGVAPSGTGHLLLLMLAVFSLGVGAATYRRYAPRAAENL